MNPTAFQEDDRGAVVSVRFTEEGPFVPLSIPAPQSELVGAAWTLDGGKALWTPPAPAPVVAEGGE